MCPSDRSLNPGDLRAIHELLADPGVVRYMLVPRSSSLEDSERFLTAALDDAPSVRAITCNNVLAGLCGIVVQANSEEGEIWYLVHPEWQGRGLAPRRSATAHLRVRHAPSSPGVGVLRPAEPCLRAGSGEGGRCAARGYAGRI